MSILKNWALAYADRGLAVFPLKPRGKTPACRGGFKKATTDKEQIAAWWDECPDYNIGIATGEASGGLVVIDLDVKEDKGIDGRETLRDWERKNGELPETWTSTTGGGGQHWFYKSSTEYRSRAGIYDGIDIRANGGYVVAPPSMHETGKSYEWDLHPDEYKLAQVDERVAKFLQGKAPEGGERQTFQMPGVIPEGERTNTMIRLVGSLKKKGLGDQAIKATIKSENEEKCNPPLTDQELEKTVFPALGRGWKAERPYTAALDGGKARPLKNSDGMAEPPPQVELVCMGDVEERETDWLYRPYVPRGKITLCAAYPGTGKTYLLCYMAACVSAGKKFFGIPLNDIPFEPVPPENAIYLTTEDGLGDTIKKRLRICGADMSHVFSVDKGKSGLLFDSPQLEQFMKDKKPALMIFDPFQSYIGNIDMNAPNQTRDRLNHIADLAEKYNVAVVLICHFNKNQKGDAITRILGSTDIVGISRSYLALGNVPDNDAVEIKFMSHEKSSLAKRGDTILFEINPDQGGIKYCGASALLMDDYTAIRNKQRQRSAPALEAAKSFLISQMPEGKRAAKELYNLAKGVKISEQSLRRAKQELRIKSDRRGYQGGVVWYLPGHENDDVAVTTPP